MNNRLRFKLMLRFFEQLPHKLVWFFTYVLLNLNPLSSASEASQGINEQPEAKQLTLNINLQKISRPTQTPLPN